MPMRSAIIVALLVAVCCGVAAHAQVPVALVDLEVDLWPEYDRPGVLVIYRATISPGVRLPAAMSLRIPAAAGAPSAVAERDPAGQLTVVQYQLQVEGDWATITFAASRPVIQVEYYDPRIQRDGAVRSFDFIWPGDLEVGALSVSVQQPDLAQNLTTVPEATSRGTAGDGLMYHTVVFPGTAAGTVAELSLRYEKVSEQLSVETMTPVEQAAPPPGPAAPSGDQSILVIVVGLLAAAGAVGAILVWNRSRGASGRAALNRPGALGPEGGREPTSQRPAGTSRGGAEPRRRPGTFCTQCGTQVASGDRFCGACGNPLR